MKSGKIFLCALCGTSRQMRYKSRLSKFNYLQLGVVAGSLSYFLFPLMEFKVVYLFPILLVIYEMTNKILYRKELSCPHCGFDPVWYKRDVKMARKKVETFWAAHPQKKHSAEEVLTSRQ
jgi:hypothetical protein